MNILLIGPPGSGKGTQAEILAKITGMTHINAGESLRTEVRNDTEIGKMVGPLMGKGNLVPDEMVIKAIQPQLDTNSGDNLILDGYPRSLDQAFYLEKVLSKYGTGITKVLELKVPDDIATERMILRRRTDDVTVGVIENRLNVYKNKTEPLIKYYSDIGIITEINGEKKQEEVTKSILEALDE